MKQVKNILFFSVLLLYSAGTAWAEDAFFAVLAERGKPNCTLVIADKPSFMEEKAAAEIARVILRDSGAEVTTQHWSELSASPSGNIVLLGTPDSVPLIGKWAREFHDGIGDLPLGGPDGYAVQTIEREKAKYLTVAGASPRAVFYGAVYAGEQVLQPRRGGNIAVAAIKKSRVPAIAERAPYCIAGFAHNGPEWPLEAWKQVMDNFAREGINRVLFWWESLYKPKTFPDARNLDGGIERIAMTDSDVGELARYAHKLGMKFLIGGGAFAWGGASALVDVYPEVAAKDASGMCPSNPKAREIQTKFTLEMLESVPDADGIWFEPRDEHGECRCDVCQVPVDDYGSKQYGQSEITWLKSFAKALWSKRPDGEIAWLIELYKPSKMHSEDPVYFENIAQIKDPRIQWIVVWGAWDFPGPGGEYRPISFFSRQNLHWNKPYAMTLEAMRESLLRTADMGLLGYSPAFEPWFAGQYYQWEIPYPMDVLPYELTSYAFREFCWEPAQTMDEFKAKMRRRYFGPEAPMELVDDLIYLRQFVWDNGAMLASMTGKATTWTGRQVPATPLEDQLKTIKGYNATDKKNALDRLEKNLIKLQKIRTEGLPRFAVIEERMRTLDPQATLRDQASFALMRKCITAMRGDHETIGLVEEQIKQMLTDIAELHVVEQ